MAKENMQLGEGFSAEVKKSGGESPSPKPRHYAIGWSIVALLLGMGGYWIWGPSPAHRPVPAMQEAPGLNESLDPARPEKKVGVRFGGVLYYDIIRAAINVPQGWEFGKYTDALLKGKIHEQTHFGPIRNTIVNEGETALRDCFIATSCTDTQNFKYHGLGTSSAGITETDGGCTTELTTQYNPDSTRATGSQTNNGANIYRTVGTNTVDAGVTIAEFCLMATSTGAGTMWSRILTGSIALNASDSLQTTYDLTIE